MIFHTISHAKRILLLKIFVYHISRFRMVEFNIFMRMGMNRKEIMIMVTVEIMIKESLHLAYNRFSDSLPEYQRNLHYRYFYCIRPTFEFQIVAIAMQI